MNQAEVSKLMSQLRVAIHPRHRNLTNKDGPEGRMLKLRKTLTALIKYERIELFTNRAHEARGYTERLISDAIRYGDSNKAMMEMADYWMLEKQLVHKLFKVIVPRFQNFTLPVTTMYRAPREYPASTHRKLYFERSLLELKGNPYPAVAPNNTYRNKNLIHNVLLDAAKRDFYDQTKLSPSLIGNEEEISKSEENDNTIEFNEKK